MPDERRVNKMDKKRIEQIRQKYDLIMHVNEEADVEFWYARELMELLGYNRWENFDKAVCRAMESCKTSGIEILDHFREVTKMIWVQAREGFTTGSPAEFVSSFRRRAARFLCNT